MAIIVAFQNRIRILHGVRQGRARRELWPYLFRFIPELQSINLRYVEVDDSLLPNIHNYWVNEKGHLISVEAITAEGLLVSKSLGGKIDRVLAASERLDVQCARLLGGFGVQAINDSFTQCLEASEHGETTSEAHQKIASYLASEYDTEDSDTLLKVLEDQMQLNLATFNTEVARFLESL